MNMRIGGLASGIDTDSIIKDLMKAHRISVDNMKQQRQLVEWQRDAYAEINAKLREFRNNALFTFNKEGTVGAKKAVVSGSSSAISAKALGTAQTSVLNVRVETKASAATLYKNEITNADNIVADWKNTTFSINDDEVTITEDDTFASVIEKINKNTDVTAFFDEASGKLSFVSKKTGVANGIEFSGGFLENGLGLQPTDVTAGSDATVHINGIETKQASNTFTVNGIEITINAADNVTNTIEVKTDTDKIIESVKTFLEEYNKINAALTEQLNAQRYRSFTPLTDEQKEEMSEKEIELWEGKAKSGVLRNDSILESAYNQLRYAASAVVNNSSDYNTLADIGITTGTYSERGKLYLDEDELREAIETDPNAVVSLITGKGGNGDDSVGIAERMDGILQQALKDISAKAGTSAYGDASGFNKDAILSERLDDFDDQIDQMNDRLAQVENRYYRQFAAMEAAIQRLNSQSTYLMNQFGGGM